MKASDATKLPQVSTVSRMGGLGLGVLDVDKVMTSLGNGFYANTGEVAYYLEDDGKAYQKAILDIRVLQGCIDKVRIRGIKCDI